LTLIVNFVFTIFLIFGLGLLFLVGERYIAEISYSNGESALARSDLDQGISNLGKAVRLNPNVDVYITELSQSYLSKALALAGNKNLSDTDKKNVQLLINNSINAAKVATDVSPNNVSNWSIRGFIYQSLIGLVPGAEDWSINSYDKASLLEPANPYYPTQEGITLIKKSMALPAGQDSSKNQILDQAKDKFDSAVKLKPDYSPALFQIAMVYQAEGKSDQEISALENTIKSAPNDVGLAFQIGVIYYQAGNYQGAKLALERAVALSPNYANALYFLGLTYDKLGQKDKAIAAISNVVNLNPNNADVKKVLSNLQSGKNALDGIAPKTPPQAPVQEAPPEKSKK
jgi:tetratricopeptide (TPR) repeat protein